MRAVFTTDALLLRAADYRDTDRMLTLLTPDHGIVSAIARGAKSSRKRFQGVLEPYCVLHIELESVRADQYTLKRAEPRQVFSGILAELDRIQAAGAALRLVRALAAARVADPTMFLALLHYLTLVEHQGDPERACLVVFALRVLALSGHALGLSRCGRSGDRVPEGRAAFFDPAIGSVVAARLGGGPILLSASLRQRLVRAQGEDWLGEARTPFGEAELALARSAVSAFIAHHAPVDVGDCLFPERL